MSLQATTARNSTDDEITRDFSELLERELTLIVIYTKLEENK